MKNNKISKINCKIIFLNIKYGIKFYRNIRWGK